MIGDEGEQLANLFTYPTTLVPSDGHSAKATSQLSETMITDQNPLRDVDGSKLLATLAVREIVRPLQRTMKDYDSPLEKLMADWITQKTKR